MKDNNWLQNNIAPLLAVVITVFALFIYLMVLTKTIVATENIAFLIITSVTNVLLLIIGYYFGSSSGSKEKQKSLDKINDNTTTLTQSIKEGETK